MHVRRNVFRRCNSLLHEADKAIEADKAGEANEADKIDRRSR